MRRLRERLSFANVMSVIAVCIALGGTAYAANKISGKSIKNSTISKKKLKANVLKGLDTCPSGATNYTQGICYSGKFGAVDWDIAARDCASKGLRLPDLGEGLLISNKTSLPYLWTTDISDTGPPSTRVVFRTDESGPGRIATQIKTTPTEYVCVLNATNPQS